MLARVTTTGILNGPFMEHASVLRTYRHYLYLYDLCAKGHQFAVLTGWHCSLTACRQAWTPRGHQALSQGPLESPAQSSKSAKRCLHAVQRSSLEQVHAMCKLLYSRQPSCAHFRVLCQGLRQGVHHRHSSRSWACLPRCCCWPALCQLLRTNWGLVY
jgi:hypothetical protein